MSFILDPIDNFLNNITMYRLVLYYLILLLVAALFMGLFGILPYSPVALVESTALLLAVGWVSNKIFAWAFDAPTNVESVYISALILALILTPIKNIHDLPLFFWATVWTMASKFIFAWHRKHIFNPVAFGTMLVGLTLGQAASWWVGTLPMLPFVLLGVLIVRKIRRTDLVFYFTATALISVALFSILQGKNPVANIERSLLYSPLFFFAFIMITEPLTTPPTERLQSIYGALVGFMFAPQFHIGSFFTTPEIALVLGNIYSYLVSPKMKLLLTLKEKIRLSPDIYDFVFVPDRPMAYAAGQYMEWTLPHSSPDTRGNRRYFTLASSPTEREIRMGVKFYPESSSYKESLVRLGRGSQIVAAQLAGDFTLPKDSREKLVLIAGGIGITPFRSMIKYLIDTKQKRDVVLFYSVKKPQDIVYDDIFEQAAAAIGLKVYYVVTDKTSVAQNWNGFIGQLTADEIKSVVPDYASRTFYLSGPHVMVDAFERSLKQIGIGNRQIKIDYFPGFA